jgi:hypothetical protein
VAPSVPEEYRLAVLTTAVGESVRKSTILSSFSLRHDE